MAELVDATDLKSVGACPRAGSIPAFRTTLKHPLSGVFLLKRLVNQWVKKSKILKLFHFDRFMSFI